MMTRKILFASLFLMVFTMMVNAQEKDPFVTKRNHYSLAIGFGWVHYINTLEIGKDLATINSPGLSARFYWEPEHRLSLGLETGYYRLYKVKGTSDTGLSGEATMAGVPFLLEVRMRVIDRVHVSVGAGLAAMFNNVKGIDKEISSTIISYSNFQVGASYIYPLTKHWQVGGEFKAVAFGKTFDWLYTLQAFCAVRF